MIANKKITIIGGGNMGSAIAKGIVSANLTTASQITLTRRNAEHLQTLKAEGFNVSTDNKTAVSNADIVLFAVKPWLTIDVITEVAPHLKKNALILSVATGISLQQLDEALAGKYAIVRAMPNTAAEVRKSVTALCLKSTTEEQANIAKEIFEQIGLCVVIDEQLMPAITALASCGIAHALRFIRAMMESGIEMGLTSKQSAQIAAQTVKGAAELILKNNSHPEVEIDKVCTPKGVTITGINEMEHAGFTSAVIKGIMGSYNKIVGK